MLERKQLVSMPLETVFDFFSHPENLAKLTPDELAFKILTPLPIEMKEGALIDYTINITGFSMRWTTMITHYDPPHEFIDQQLKGPYSFWHHTHTFEETSAGTLIKDKVIYALPLGILGRIAHGLFIKKHLNKIFDYRSKVIGEYFSNQGQKSGQGIL
jgi:ligand-binding SRPBCC domain-containing protein